MIKLGISSYILIIVKNKIQPWFEPTNKYGSHFMLNFWKNVQSISATDSLK